MHRQQLVKRKIKKAVAKSLLPLTKWQKPSAENENHNLREVQQLLLVVHRLQLIKLMIAVIVSMLPLMKQQT
jgi:hypothetical protein